MKFRKIIEQDTEENELLKIYAPNVKPKWIKIDLELKNKIKKWYKNNKYHSDFNKSINHLKNIKTKNFSPIIIHVYHNEKYIIDGWHRAYVAVILRNEDKIKAYVKN